MTNVKEYWDIYNQNREKTGKVHLRGQKLKAGEFHLVVTILIINSDGQLLIQKRAADKQQWPNLWDFSVAGSALAGENSQQAAEREAKEELGVNLDLSKGRILFSWHFPNGFDDFWIIEKNICLSEINLQKEEVQDVRWATEQKLRQLSNNNEFIAYFFLDQVFSLIKRKHLQN